MFNKVNGIHYELIGESSSKKNLVFVHGSGCNHRFLKPLAKELTEYNCYLIDLPDHGESDNRNCTKVEDYVDAVAEFVSNLEDVTIIGHSLGGTICVGVAAKCIPSVKKNVVISSGARFYTFDQRIYDMVNNNKVNWEYLFECLGRYDDIDPEALKLDPDEIMLKDFNIDIALDLEHVMSDINIPTLIMVSEDDILTIPEFSNRMHEGIKGSKLVMAPDRRHLLPIAKPTYVAGLIREFVNE
ncbi:MAG: alpha/beta hydrolase [Bacillota bacterium]|nr:alpha/beta hydrolase [Bacillota bacterium]